MTISYNWLIEYIPVPVSEENISKILTSIGLEVESYNRYESIKGGLKGLVAGEVMECIQHPGADKLKLTRVNVGGADLLQIVCGAPNVAAGQKVIVAPAGTTIFPVNGDPILMKVAKIRGEESFGMICAEDEIGLGQHHNGIVILDAAVKPGTAIAELYKPYTDTIYEIGLTPNRMDAMSHQGVARDVCAYLTHHQHKEIKLKPPVAGELKSGSAKVPFSVVIENTVACKRFAGVCIAGIEVKASPQWLQQKLKSIGHRSINNIVDITNYILHDTGQPLHAYDANKIAGNKILVKNLPGNTIFKTLDDKDRKLSSEDLMICDANSTGLCIAGVFGGAESGVQPGTKNIFLESAWFNPIDIRKTSFRHGLRTDAAARFEKNVDISITLDVLKRATQMIMEVAGGTISSDFIDQYPSPEKQAQVTLLYSFLKKLSGKAYEPSIVKNILLALGFKIEKEDEAGITLAVPYSKPDITLPADLVEEIMRIDGYDNIEIPLHITISPSVGGALPHNIRKEKISSFLVGAGFREIFTNSITNAAYFENEELKSSVRLLNNLSAMHNIMRPEMLQTGLESVAYNLNRKNTDLQFFEFGKTYHSKNVGQYQEDEHLSLYITGNRRSSTWKNKSEAADIFYIKGIVEALFRQLGIAFDAWNKSEDNSLAIVLNNQVIVRVENVAKTQLIRFDIRQEVFFADINWNMVQNLIRNEVIQFQPLPNQLPVLRDLAMVVPASLAYQRVEDAVRKLNLNKLISIHLFDIFESEKLGKAKKSLAVTFTFLDPEKTLTDKEIDGMMNRIMLTLEQELNAEIRKGAQNTTI
ncbi:MAG: phenylalanine--tRNA ligase subunit beta [Flavitalea sp.]